MNVLELREKTPDELDEQLALLKKSCLTCAFKRHQGKANQPRGCARLGAMLRG